MRHNVWQLWLRRWIGLSINYKVGGSFLSSSCQHAEVSLSMTLNPILQRGMNCFSFSTKIKALYTCSSFNIYILHLVNICVVTVALDGRDTHVINHYCPLLVG